MPIGFLREAIPLRREDTMASDRFHCQVEPTNAREEINESERTLSHMTRMIPITFRKP